MTQELVLVKADDVGTHTVKCHDNSCSLTHVTAPVTQELVLVKADDVGTHTVKCHDNRPVL